MAQKIAYLSIAAVFVLGVSVGVIAILPYTNVCPMAQYTMPQYRVPLIINASRSATVHIVGASVETGLGVMGTASVELVPGRGRILVSTNPFIEPDTQQSVAIAKDVAENVTSLSLESTDIVATLDLLMGNTSIRLIGGPSAGAAITAAIIAAALNTTVRDDIVITGEILPDGSIGEVGGILEKAQAAGEAGMKLIIVPMGQGTTTYYEKSEVHETSDGFTITRISYLSNTTTLNDYTQQWGMFASDAENIMEVAEAVVVNFTQLLK